jgi:beta-galactosidase
MNGTSGGNVEVGLRHYATRPYLAGLFYWTGFDYRGESNPYGFPAVSSQFGILDTCGFPKDSFFYLKARWGTEPLLKLVPHWNFQGREGQPIEVRAFSNLSEVELFLNGRSLGKKAIERYGHAAWSVPYEPGALSAKGFVDGAARLEARVETTTAPKQLRMEADRAAIRADGRDLAVVTVSAVDAQGRPVPTADIPVELAVNGPGRILGVGNGDPSSHEPDRIFPKVTTLPFADFREERAPNGSIHRGTLTTRGLPKGGRIRLLLRHFGASAVVELNGRKVATTEMKGNAPLPSIELTNGLVREGRNTLVVTATRYENDRMRERATKVPHAVLRIEAPPPRWSRRLFNGLAQVIAQSNGEPGPIRITATAPGLSPAELTVVTAPPR